MADLLDLLGDAPEERQLVAVLGGEIEIRALSIDDIRDLSKRFPDFRKTLFRRDAPEDFRGIAILEAMPAIIAIGLGHPGDQAYEAAAKRLPHAEMMRLGNAVLRLSLGGGEDEAGDQPDPLPSSGEVVAEARGETAPTISPPPSNT